MITIGLILLRFLSSRVDRLYGSDVNYLMMDMVVTFRGKSSGCSIANVNTLQKILTEAAVYSGSRNLAQFANQATVRCFGKEKKGTTEGQR